MSPTPLTPYVKYRLRFTSLVAPTTFTTTSNTNYNSYFPLPKRTLTRRSYAIVSWLYYLSFTNSPISVNNLKERSTPTLSILPSKQLIYTLPRAPMAHKTNSKEQFLVKTYNFQFLFRLACPQSSVISTVMAGAHTHSLTKTFFPTFETNLLTLKSYSVSYPLRDSKFFARLL